MDLGRVFEVLGIITLAAPAALLAVLGLTALFVRPLGESAMARWTQASVIVGLTASIGILGLMLLTGVRYVPVELGNWVSIPEQHFHFHLKFVFDRLSVPFVILTFVLVGTIGAFANRYLHREQGYTRFFLFYAIFLLGMIVASLAGTIETLFVGWELVGLSSALLVAYFHERRSPVTNGFRVWSIYRIADAAFLAAAVALHHLTGAGDFTGMMGVEPWPEGTAAVESGQIWAVGVLLLIAAAGKSALIPFSGWLPRAMEGPTPSSAVFYGALSVHLGVFLLLRISPLLAASPGLSAALIILGVSTAVVAALCSRVQSDVKTALAYASVTQVGIITAEIGLGLRYVALIHIIGHACLRTLQLLRAPSLLHDVRSMENALGRRLSQSEGAWHQRLPHNVWLALYRFALARGHFDNLIDRFVVAPFCGVFEWCDRMERRWNAFLSGTPANDGDRQRLEELNQVAARTPMVEDAA